MQEEGGVVNRTRFEIGEISLVQQNVDFTNYGSQ